MNTYNQSDMNTTMDKWKQRKACIFKQPTSQELAKNAGEFSKLI